MGRLCASFLFFATCSLAQSPLGETFQGGPFGLEGMVAGAADVPYFAGQNGLYRIANGAFDRLASSEEIGIPIYLAYAADSNTMWAGTSTGLWSYDGKSFRQQAEFKGRVVFYVDAGPGGHVLASVGAESVFSGLGVTLHLLRAKSGSIIQSAKLADATRISRPAFDKQGNLYYAAGTALHLLNATDIDALFQGRNLSRRIHDSAPGAPPHLSAHIAPHPVSGAWVYMHRLVRHYDGPTSGQEFGLPDLVANAATGPQISTCGDQLWLLANSIPHLFHNGALLRWQTPSPELSPAFRGIYCSPAGKLWLGHDLVAILHSPAAILGHSQQGAAPFLRVQADGAAWQSPTSTEIPYGDHTIRADLGVPRLRPVAQPEEFNFRFRLFPLHPNWQTSKSPQALFAVSQPGHYRLEADLQRNGQWSPTPAVFEFDIATRPVPTWAWPLAATALAATALAVFFWRQRVRESKWGIPDTTLGQRYKITDKLAETNISLVFRALDTKLAKRPVALKVIRRVSVEKASLTAFRREVEALSRLRHRGIVAIQDVGVLADGRPFLVMELVEGASLREILQTGPLPVDRAARILAQLGETIAIAHQNGILHRDLKPENLMLEFPATVRENLVVLDFGTARIANPDSTLESVSGGTLDYMAPEQLFGHSSERTDIYACGLVLFEMLTGKRLTELMCDNPKDVEQALRRELAAVLLPLPAEAIDSILAAVNPDPDLRPQQVGPWSQTLSEALSASATI